MFGLFKSKTEKLQDKYEKLMSEAHKLSHTNRRAADEKYAEADKVMDVLERLKQKEG